MIAPDWLDTARKLKAHSKCPAGLAQYTVSRGKRVMVCGGRARRSEPLTRCACGASYNRAEWHYPDADLVPDLSSEAIGPLYAALSKACRDSVDLSCDARCPPRLRHAVVIDREFPPYCAPCAVEALALAFLAVIQ